eukprot:541666-Prorocentrum_minimum.AAC.1
MSLAGRPHRALDKTFSHRRIRRFPKTTRGAPLDDVEVAGVPEAAERVDAVVYGGGRYGEAP